MAAAAPVDVAHLEVVPSSPGYTLRPPFLDRRDRTGEAFLAVVAALPRDDSAPIAPLSSPYILAGEFTAVHG